VTQPLPTLCDSLRTPSTTCWIRRTPKPAFRTQTSSIRWHCIWKTLGCRAAS